MLAAYDRLVRGNSRPDCFPIKAYLSNPTGSSRMFLAEFAKYCEMRHSL